MALFLFSKDGYGHNVAGDGLFSENTDELLKKLETTRLTTRSLVLIASIRRLLLCVIRVMSPESSSTYYSENQRCQQQYQQATSFQSSIRRGNLNQDLNLSSLLFP